MLRVHQMMRALGSVGDRELDALAWPLNALPVGQSNDLELTIVEILPVV